MQEEITIAIGGDEELIGYLLADGVRLSDVESLIKLVKDTAIDRVKGNIV